MALARCNSHSLKPRKHAFLGRISAHELERAETVEQAADSIWIRMRLRRALGVDLTDDRRACVVHRLTIPDTLEKQQTN